MKLFKHLISLFILSGLFLCSCQEEPDPTSPTTPPTASVTINNVSRTEVSFSIQSKDAQDYVYTIVEGSKQIASAEELFEIGENGMLEGGKADLTVQNLKGDSEYTLYVAVRKINPYVYSEVYSEEISTDIPYTSMLTLDNIGYTDYTYHVEVPEGATVRHISIKRLDYEAIKAIIGDYGDVTHAMYLATFGHNLTESDDITIDKCSKTSLDDDIFVYSGTDYILMAGEVDEENQVIDGTLEIIEFTTRKAEECPYDINITAEPFSNRVLANITPEEGIVSYRVKIDTRREFDYVGGEGEDHLKSFVIGPWYIDSNEYTEAVQVESTGLRPNTEYVVGVVGFDAHNGEVFKTFNFTTGAPVGPEPVIELTQVTPSVNNPWSNAAVNTKVQHAIEIRGGFFLKSSLDEVISAGNSLSSVIYNNGYTFTNEELSYALSESGCTSEVEELEAETEYVFGVIATNDEFVTAYDTLVFKTAKLPQSGGSVRDNMPGNYTASTTDADGNTVTFPVTIATGVNEETEAEYFDKNRLVCLGFGPEDQFPYVSPEEIEGESDSTSRDYGPKWFIEFREDEKLVAPSTCDPNNTSEFAWTMGLIDGNYAYMWGYGIRESTGRDTDANSIEFDVEVSEDGNTITVKGTMGQFGGTTYYPTMAVATDTWWTDEVLFRCHSDLVLTRNTEAQAQRCVEQINVPEVVTLAVGGYDYQSAIDKAAEHLSR